MNWAKEEYTTPARPSAVASAASTTAFGHPLLQEPTAGGRIHWASTETATDYAGHVEGAIRAGIHAAEHVEGGLRTSDGTFQRRG